jgi:hypothetical protein
MRRIILSIAAAVVIGTSLVGAAPAKAAWPYNGGGYYHDGWRAQEWRQHRYWAWRHHLWWQAHRGGYWYR